MRLFFPSSANSAKLRWDLAQEKRAREDEEGRRCQIMILISFLEMEDKKKFHDYLTMDGVHRRDRRIPRCALHYPASSPWMKLYSSLNDQPVSFDHVNRI